MKALLTGLFIFSSMGLSGCLATQTDVDDLTERLDGLTEQVDVNQQRQAVICAIFNC